MNMKKKSKYRFLSIIFCFMFMLFAGCDGGMGGIGGDSPRSLDGVKVLSKPATYSFSEAVGDYASEYYYNLFAREILSKLYSVYEDISYQSGSIADALLDNLDTLNGETYENFSDENNKFYLFDSLRYTIKSVTNTNNESGDLVRQTIIIDTNSKWNWTIENKAGNYSNIFEKLTEETSSYNSIVTYNSTTGEIIISDTSLLDLLFEIFTSSGEIDNYFPYFGQIYDSNIKAYKEGTNITNYWSSPYYQREVEGKTDVQIDAVNYFQDAFEYVTYLFVLGYDYVNVSEDGNKTPSEDAPLFTFTTTYGADGLISGISVNGWGNTPISIGDALGRVKALYKDQGGYIGITAENKEQIKRFIQDVVLGENAYKQEYNQISIGLYENTEESGVASQPVKTGELKLNRNYDKIIENVIDYACGEAPIGYDSTYDNGDGTTGKTIGLDSPYVVSKITDYKGDYFFANYENNDDSQMFKYIDAAEYQSMVLYPQETELNIPLSDIWIGFEYFENPDSSKTMAESITINVGFRYFSSTANGGQGEIVCSGEKQLEVKYGKNGEVSGENPDVNWVYIGYSELEQGQYDIALTKDLAIKTKFNSNIGNSVINPFVSGTEITTNYASKLISGTDKAREYYKLNPSSSYGFYGTLDESKFSVQNAGADACDFLELYFDVVKVKGASGINYNYKVALIQYAVEDV